MMNTKLLLTAIAATVFSVSAYAHDCSGGPGGGMDATGNQCNDEAAYSASESNVQDAKLIAPKTFAAPATTVSTSAYAPASHSVKSKKSTHQTPLNAKTKRS
jgi:hypothetical protein